MIYYRVFNLITIVLLVVAVTVTAEKDCLEDPPEPILVEAIGNVDGSEDCLNDAIRIVASATDSESGINYVTFTVNQLWKKEGTPMLSVSYPGGYQGEGECDMQTGDGDAAGLITFNSTREYTAQCSHGYAEVGVYLFVGDSNDFDIEECESCAVPNADYTGYYLRLSCDRICEEAVDEDMPSDSLTYPPTQGFEELPELLASLDPKVEEAISEDPFPSCPEDIALERQYGRTDFSVNQAIQILSKDTSTVTIKLTEAWMGENAPRTNIDHIFISYKTSMFSTHCYEFDDVPLGDVIEEELTITCNVLKPRAFLTICVADALAHGVLGMADDAKVPKCCQPSFPPDTPVVCYSLLINCETECIDESQRRKLSSPTKGFLRSGR